MNDSHRTGHQARLRSELETQRRQVVDDLQRCLTRLRQVGPRALDEEGAEDDSSEIDVGLVNLMNATVHRIDAALERLANGTYGQCARCHRPIADARLRAMPFAVRCQKCEASREHDAKVRRARARVAPWDGGHTQWELGER